MKNTQFTIGIPRETKVPVDNRVIFSPDQAEWLMKQYPMLQIIVETSKVRCFADDLYRDKGVKVVDDLGIVDCDIIIGVKEQEQSHIIPNRHYVFFGHFAKTQEYNRPLAQYLLANKNTFTDHEYLVDSANKRLCTFGKYAGVVGAYNAIRGYGIREKLYTLPTPNSLGVVEKLCEEIRRIEVKLLPDILFTGGGNVASGCGEFLRSIGYQEVSIDQYHYIQGVTQTPLVVNLLLQDIVQRCDGKPFDRNDFTKYPSDYQGCLAQKIIEFPVFISCHYWGERDPIYLNHEDLRELSGRLKVVADITCDICGGLMCTKRPSTHNLPFYDYDPISEQDVDAFSNPSNITIMAVDTLPNAVPITSSIYFGDQYIAHIIPGLLGQDKISREVIDRATIIKNGRLTSRFAYLEDFVKG